MEKILPKSHELELLQRLINALGPSGCEHVMRNIISQEIKPFVDQVYTDKFGNLIAHKVGKGPKIMLAAHMDEIGLMVKEITPTGHLHFAAIGGIEPITLVGQKVCILSDKDHSEFCTGVVTFRELQEDLDIDYVPEMDDLFVDAGFSSKKEAVDSGISIGTYMVPRHHFAFLGNEKFVVGKAMDDRIGCYMLIRLAERLKSTNKNIYFVFTVQEEVGLYGAETSVWEINPDWGLAVDVASASDYYEDGNIFLGKGPTVIVKDVEMIANQCINSWLKEVGKKHDINIQWLVEEFGTTDATKIMMSRGGVPSSTVGVALRNLHTTVGIANVDDIQKAIDLLYHLLRRPLKQCVITY